MGSEARARLGLAALLGVTLMAFGSLFSKSDYMGPTLLGMLLAVALTLLCRRWGAGPLLTIVGSTALLGCYLLIVFQGPRTFYGLPTTDAAAGLGRLVVGAIQASNLDFAPVPPRPGYVVMTVVAMWLITTLSEVATFRWRRPLLASLPPIGLFSFLLVIGRRSLAGFLLVVFIGALLTYWGLEASHRLRSWGRWVGAWGHREDASSKSVTGRVARRMGYSCVAAALVAPMILPALGTGLLSWRNPTGAGEGPGTGIIVAGGRTINPFVELHPQLLNQDEDELFKVTADRKAYWRLLSLADFDGARWTEAQAPVSTTGGGLMEAAADPTAYEVLLTQTFDLTNLGGSYLPAAVRPSSISFADGPRSAKYNSQTRHLQVTEGDVQGLRYTVTSKVPKLSFAAMKGAKIGEQPQQYTEVPSDLSPEVYDLVEEWTKDAKSDFAKLIALQSRFQTDFAYSEDVDTDDSKDYLTYFLTKSKTGYCQQFSTAFALLARTLGYPSRVSVGFLPGEPLPDDDDTLVVRGTHAHAWPEVYFEDYGWVRFEPTPRSEAQLPSYTIDPSPGTGRGAAGGDRFGANVDPNVERLGLGNDVAAANLDARRGTRPDRTERPGNGYAWQETFGRLARALVIAVVVFLLLVPFLKELRTRYRYARSSSPSSATAAAFAQFVDEAGELAGERRPAESATAYAWRVVSMGRAPADPALRLASLYEIAEYSPTGASLGQAREARRLVRRLRSSLWARASWLKRASLLFSPARLRPPLRPRPTR